jgi:hypothetical protein
MTDSSSGEDAMDETDHTYRIRLRGHLDDRWSDWFGGLAIQRRDDGTTVLVGPVIDQAALHGVLARIRDLGLPLLAVDRVEPKQADAPSVQ